MKRVVSSIVPDVVTANQVSKEKFYGVIVTSFEMKRQERSFITRQNFDNGNFILRGFMEESTNGNCWNDCDAPTLKGFVDKALKRKWEVYEFDTARELYNWIGEGQFNEI